jgi:hypothetical protein
VELRSFRSCLSGDLRSPRTGEVPAYQGARSADSLRLRGTAGRDIDGQFNSGSVRHIYEMAET